MFHAAAARHRPTRAHTPVTMAAPAAASHARTAEVGREGRGVPRRVASRMAHAARRMAGVKQAQQLIMPQCVAFTVPSLSPDRRPPAQSAAEARAEAHAF